MQKSNLRRLSTPTQPQSRQPSNLYRSHPDGYPQRLAPLPAAHGYHPQTIWVPDYRPPPGGPRAVPMRMQRLTMSQTDTRPMPIPSIQLGSDRPYSVPNYHSSRKSRGDDDSFNRPPRPASTSEVDDIDKLVPRRQLPFPNRSTAQSVENDSLASRRSNLDDPEPLSRMPKATRRVAKRGSQVSASDDNMKIGGHSEFDLTPEQGSSRLTGNQKHGNDYTADEPNPSKRIKINVVRSQSQTPTVREITNQTYPNTRLRAQFGRNNYETDVFTEKKANQNVEVDDDETESSEGENDAAEPILTSKRLGQFGTGKPDPYNIMDGVGPLEIPEDARESSKRALINIEETNTSSDVLGSSSATHREPHTNNQHRQYANASSQCAMPSEQVPRAGQVKPETKAMEHHQSAAVIGNVLSTRDAREGKVNEETLDARLSRIEKAIRVQEEEGVDEFIKTKLSTGGPNTLGTLTNEILLALVVPNDELLEQVIKIV